MNFSMKWLNEFVNINNIDPKEFSEKITKTGSRVVKYKKDGEKLNNIVVGKVLFIDEHPFADRLLVCKVDIGKDKPLQIVTNAQNLRAGNLVPVALDGSTLADGTKIEEGKIRNILSHGMFCSIKELGVTKRDFPGAVEDEVLILENDCELGKDIRDAIDFNDTNFEIEISDNRPDCFSVIGMSREISAAFNKLLRIHTPMIKNSVGDAKELLNVKVEVPNICKFYSSKIIKNIKLGESPKWLRDRLKSMGILPVNNIVDIANYVMLEYGHPINVYDLKGISDSTIIVRRAMDGETITTLDNEELSLTSENVVIADNEKVLSVAGIIKGNAACITGDTTMVVFEAADFDKDFIKTTSKKLGITTESSKRFGNGTDVNNCIPSLQRVSELVEMLEAGDVVGSTVDSGRIISKPQKIALDSDFINNFLNTDINADDMKRILKKLGCSIDDNTITVPSYRPDLTHISDIAGEIIRFYGYDNIDGTEVKGIMSGKYSNKASFLRNLRKASLFMGLNETVTESFISLEELDKLLIDGNNSKYRNKELQVSPGVILKTIGIPSIIENIKINRLKGAFEITDEYLLNDDNKKIANDKVIVAIYGDELDFYNIKGIAEILLKASGIDSYELTENDSCFLHPGKSANIIKNNSCIGYLGELHPKVKENYQLKENMLVLNLDISTLFEFYR